MSNTPVSFNEYQAKCKTYHFCHTHYSSEIVHILGLAGEAGEVVEKYKKHLRDATPLDIKDLKKELSDILFYVAAVADDHGLTLESVARAGLKKLKDRKKRGTMSGSGDNR